MCGGGEAADDVGLGSPQGLSPGMGPGLGPGHGLGPYRVQRHAANVRERRRMQRSGPDRPPVKM